MPRLIAQRPYGAWNSEQERADWFAAIATEKDEKADGNTLASRAEAQLLLDAGEMLRTIEKRAASASWGTPTEPGRDEPTAFAYGRSAEACDRAAAEIDNALITLSVWGKSEAAAAALKTDDDETGGEPND